MFGSIVSILKGAVGPALRTLWPQAIGWGVNKLVNSSFGKNYIAPGTQRFIRKKAKNLQQMRWQQGSQKAQQQGQWQQQPQKNERPSFNKRNKAIQKRKRRYK